MKLIRCIALLAVLILPSCAPSSDSADSSQLNATESNDPLYILGTQKGRLEEKIENYKKAIRILLDQRQNIEQNITTMSAKEIYAIQKVEQVLTDQMKILEVKPMQNVIKQVNKIKINLDKSVKVIKMIEGLEPIMLEYIETVSFLGDVHKAFFTFFSDIGGVIPFVHLYAKFLDSAFQDYAAMQISIANSALFESVASKSVAQEEIDVTQDKMGLLNNYQEYSHYFEFWSSVGEGRNFLKEITGEYPPRVTWKCKYFCTRKVSNTNPGEVENFRKFLDKHSDKIYVAIDELRISRGPDKFPIFYGPRSWKTEVGGSRQWRKPKMLKSIDDQVRSLNALVTMSETVIGGIDAFAAALD